MFWSGFHFVSFLFGGHLPGDNLLQWAGWADVAKYHRWVPQDLWGWTVLKFWPAFEGHKGLVSWCVTRGLIISSWILIWHGKCLKGFNLDDSPPGLFCWKSEAHALDDPVFLISGSWNGHLIWIVEVGIATLPLLAARKSDDFVFKPQPLTLLESLPCCAFYRKVGALMWWRRRFACDLMALWCYVYTPQKTEATGTLLVCGGGCCDKGQLLGTGMRFAVFWGKS